MKRYKMSSKSSKSNFTRNAVKSHRLNFAHPMRGGIRL